MLSVKGKTAFITGASSGIGKACAEKFAALGINLVITARRKERLDTLSQQLINQHGVRVTAVSLDVQKADEVQAAFAMLGAKDFGIDILVNNAGLALTTDKIQDADMNHWDTMIDTNIKGLLYVTKCALPYMLKMNQGHIVNIGSIAGHSVYAGGNVYCATKHAVRAISKSLRLDLAATAIRISEVDPGAVETEFSMVRWNDKERAKKTYEGFIPLSAEDIADAVCYCITRPPHVNISEIVIFPQAQASITDINRNISNPSAFLK